MTTRKPERIADRNCRRFVAFRVFFNARFYYPVLAVLFLDLGVSATEYSLLNFVWAIVIVCAEVPSGALADRVGRRPLVIAAGAKRATITTPTQTTIAATEVPALSGAASVTYGGLEAD